MKAKPLPLRSRAARDIEDAAQYYRREAGAKVATAFIDAIERTLHDIRRNPSRGSPRYAHKLDLPGLRHWVVKHHSFLIFYAVQPNAIEVWRALHAHRDVAAWMRPED